MRHLENPLEVDGYERIAICVAKGVGVCLTDGSMPPLPSLGDIGVLYNAQVAIRKRLRNN